jgi:hypothetical protein
MSPAVSSSASPSASAKLRKLAGEFDLGRPKVPPRKQELKIYLYRSQQNSNRKPLKIYL